MLAYATPRLTFVVTVATFNIRHGLGRDGAVDLGRTAAALTATRAGLVALQEVDRFLPRSGGVDQTEELAARTGMSGIFFPTLARGRGHYGLAVLADEPVEGHLEELPRVAGEEPRGMVILPWRGVHVVATHLAQRGEARDRQTEALAARAAALPPPVLVLGDLNQGLRTLTPLRDAGFHGGPHRATFSWGRQIDHVLVGPGLRLVDVRTVATAASDHLPLVAEIEVF